MTIQALNTNGSISAHAYTVQVTGSRVNIQQIPDTEVVRTANFETGKWYRIRRGALDVPLDGRTDGMFLNMSFLGSPAKFIRTLSDEEVRANYASARHYVAVSERHRGLFDS